MERVASGSMVTTLKNHKLSDDIASALQPVMLGAHGKIS
jgi:hypothetical protein